MEIRYKGPNPPISGLELFARKEAESGWGGWALETGPSLSTLCFFCLSSNLVDCHINLAQVILSFLVSWKSLEDLYGLGGKAENI